MTQAPPLRQAVFVSRALSPDAGPADTKGRSSSTSSYMLNALLAAIVVVLSLAELPRLPTEDRTRTGIDAPPPLNVVLDVHVVDSDDPYVLERGLEIAGGHLLDGQMLVSTDHALAAVRRLCAGGGECLKLPRIVVQSQQRFDHRLADRLRCGIAVSPRAAGDGHIVDVEVRGLFLRGSNDPSPAVRTSFVTGRGRGTAVFRHLATSGRGVFVFITVEPLVPDAALRRPQASAAASDEAGR